MSRTSLAVLLLVCAVRLPAAEPTIRSSEAILDGLRAEHPRLLATAADFQRLKNRCADSDQPRKWLKKLSADAEQSAVPVFAAYAVAWSRTWRM